MGDLYGTSKEELLGFLQAITYTVENASPYEVKSGLRAPKYIFATLSFHVLHAEAPSLTTKFYSLQEPLLTYRHHKNNFTNKFNNIFISELKFWIKENEKLLNNKYSVKFLR